MSGRRYALVGALPPYRGGIAHFSLRTWQMLLAREHEVHPFTFSRQYPGLFFPGTSQFEDRPTATPAPVPRTIDSIGPWSWWSTGRSIARADCHAIVLNHWMPFFAPAYGSIVRAARRPAVAVVHNAIPHEHRPGDAALNRWFLHACRGYVVLSEEVEDDLRALGCHAPIRRIHHPVYDHFGDPIDRTVARRRLGIPLDRPLLLFFGYVRRYKGLDLLLEALAAARTTRPDLHLMVAGEFYEEQSSYRNRIEHDDLRGAVTLRSGYVPADEVALLFSACDAVVQPYRTATQSGVAQIAYHFGRAMVITDVGGLAEVVPHDEAGLVVPPVNTPALAAALERVIDPATRDRLERGVSARRPLFAWDRLGEAIESLTDESPSIG